MYHKNSCDHGVFVKVESQCNEGHLKLHGVLHRIIIEQIEGETRGIELEYVAVRKLKNGGWGWPMRRI